MATKSIKNAAKAKIKMPRKVPTKETVDTPLSECEARDPMTCKYHGLKAFENNIAGILGKLGYKGSKSVGKIDGKKGFVLYLPSPLPVDAGKLAEEAKALGLEVTDKGTNPAGGHGFECLLAKKPKKAEELFAGLSDGLEEFDDLDELAAEDVRESAGAEEVDSGEDDFDVMNSIGDPKKLKEDFGGGEKEDSFDDLDELAAEDVREGGEDEAGEKEIPMPSDEEYKDAYNTLGYPGDGYEAFVGMMQTGNYHYGKYDYNDYGGKYEPLEGMLSTFKSWIKTLALKKGKDNPVVQYALQKFASNPYGYSMAGLEEFGYKEIPLTTFDELDAHLDKIAKMIPSEWQNDKAFLSKIDELNQQYDDYHAAQDFEAALNTVKNLVKYAIQKKGPFYLEGTAAVKQEDGRVKSPPLEKFVEWAELHYPDATGGPAGFGKQLKEMVDKGTWYGEKYPADMIDKAIEAYQNKSPGSDVTKALVAKLESLKGNKESMQSLKDEWDKKVIPLVADMTAKGELSVGDNDSLFNATVDFASSQQNGDLEGMKSALAKAYGVLQKKPTEEDWNDALHIAEEIGFPFKKKNGIKILKTADYYYDTGDHEPLEGQNQDKYKKAIQAVAYELGKDSPVVKAMVEKYMGHAGYDKTGLEEIAESANPNGETGLDNEEELLEKIDGMIEDEGLSEYVSTIPSGYSKDGKVRIKIKSQDNDGETVDIGKAIKEADAVLGKFGYKIGKVDSAASTYFSKQFVMEPLSESEKKAAKGAKDAIVDSLLSDEDKEELLKPLEHDESKFPKNLTAETIEKALLSPSAKSLGGSGGCNATLIEIGGRKYVCKRAKGAKSLLLKNGYYADMAYRAGGIPAADAKLVETEDGRVFKLAEFIEGKRLSDVWVHADEKKKEELRKEILKGYPLDALFSNQDVLGSGMDNILVDKDGKAWRIDNDGSFAMTATGKVKTWDYEFGGGLNRKVEVEQYDSWADREWIDDFRKMRRMKIAEGVFDHYSTADIFWSAGDIDLGAAVAALPKPLQEAMAKPLREMKQMTWRAMNLKLSGFRNNEFASVALDASYDASKMRLRELCSHEVSWDDPGFGKFKKSWSSYHKKPFDEPEPQKPADPRDAFKGKFENGEYYGASIGDAVYKLAKSINYHAGVKTIDKDGNVLGSGNVKSPPDYMPNESTVELFDKIDRDKLVELAKTDKSAAAIVKMYDQIAKSRESGWKQPIEKVSQGLSINAKLPDGFKGETEKKLLANMADEIAAYEKAKKKYEEEEMPDYLARKKKHDDAEEQKVKEAGGGDYHNFHHLVAVLMSQMRNTDGVQCPEWYKESSTVTPPVRNNGIKPIEDSMLAQKVSSYKANAIKWKIRELHALGYSLDQIESMAKSEKLYRGSEYTPIIEKFYKGSAENETAWRKDMASQAIYCGCNMVKLENEKNAQYDQTSGVVFLNRNIADIPKGLSEKDQNTYSDSSASGWVGPHVDSAADCMQFEKNSWSGEYKQVYAVPFARMVCAANNSTESSATTMDAGYNENEYVGNLYMLPCWVYHPSAKLSWKQAIGKAKEDKGMQGYLAGLATRLKPFAT